MKVMNEGEKGIFFFLKDNSLILFGLSVKILLDGFFKKLIMFLYIFFCILE